MITREDYDTLQRQLHQIEGATGLYLADENVDAENVADAGVTLDNPEYWSLMYSNACNAAGIRAEEDGHDINKLMGKIIY